MTFGSLNASLLTLNLLSSGESPPLISASSEIFICIPRCLEILYYISVYISLTPSQVYILVFVALLAVPGCTLNEHVHSTEQLWLWCILAC